MEYIKRTKIVATLGPGCENQLEELIEAGVNVARLNFSHGDHAEHQQRWEKLQTAVKKTGKRIAIMLDTQGPKIRTGTFANNTMDLVDGDEVVLLPGNGEGGIINGKKTIYVNYANLLKLLKEHKIVYFADGLMEVKVEKLEKDKAIAKVVTGGKISNRKGVNIPHANWGLPPLNEKDIEDVKWGIKHDVDYIAQSFVTCAGDVKQLRKLLDENGGREIKIIAKIEEYPAVQNIDEIIASADGIMVARGDLGVQMHIEQVPSVQKNIIEKCNEAMKPVITATQMLESMTNRPIPTRAEVTDVANAILDGSDAVMLSGETSVGRYPVKTVQMMARVIQHTEQSLLEYGQFDRHHCKEENERNTTLSIAKAASRIATELNAAAIITYTETGRTARRVIHTRPKVPIVAVTPDEKTARKLCLCWGITSVYVTHRAPLEEVLYKVADVVTQTGIVKKGDMVVIVTGIPLGQPGSTNLIKVQML